MIALLALAPPASGADYAGTFKGNQLTVTLAAAQGRYSGTIQLEGKNFPCTAREADGQLKGAFENEGNGFEFTATLKGDTLSLQSGGTAYTLKKQVRRSQSAGPANGDQSVGETGRGSGGSAGGNKRCGHPALSQSRPLTTSRI